MSTGQGVETIAAAARRYVELWRAYGRAVEYLEEDCPEDELDRAQENADAYDRDAAEAHDALLAAVDAETGYGGPPTPTRLRG